MKKQIILLAVLAAVAASGCLSGCFGGCAQVTSKFGGEAVTKDFEIAGPYTELEVSSAFTVTVSDTVDKVQVTAGEKVMPYVLVELEGNTLRIHLKPLTFNLMSSLKVLLPYNAALTDVDLSGASDFISSFGLEGQAVSISLSGASDCQCDIRAEDVDIDASGASDFKGKITANTLSLDLSGDSDAEITGTVDKLTLDLSGASDIERTIIDKHYGLVCNSCEGSLSGASDACLHCDGTISVGLSGASKLRYTGDAATGDSSTSGGSSIKHDSL